MQCQLVPGGGRKLCNGERSLAAVCHDDGLGCSRASLPRFILHDIAIGNAISRRHHNLTERLFGFGKVGPKFIRGAS
jgi:hypothetical protein